MAKTVSILAADIGGTNARFAVFSACVSPRLFTMQRSVRLATADHPSFRALIDAAVGSLGPGFDVAGIAVPGPVAELPVPCPNVAWKVDPADAGLSPMVLLNDFAAQAWAATMPAVQNLRHVCGPRRGPDREGGVLAVLGGGTGTGCGIAIRRRGRPPVVVPSEFGHALAPLLPEEEGLAGHLRERGIRQDWDNLLSGRGVSALCAWATGRDLPPEAAAAALPEDAWRLLSRLYGRAVRQLALTVMPLGGVVIAGGVANRNPRIVTDPAFADELRACPGYEAILRGIPVDLARNDEAALWGAAACALETYVKENEES